MNHTIWHGPDDCKRYRSLRNARNAFITASLADEDVVMITKNGPNYSVSVNHSEVDIVKVYQFKNYKGVAQLLDSAFNKA